MANNRQLKEAKVQEIQEKMEKAQAIVFVKYQGLTVEEDTKLRKELRGAGVEYKVYKNTLSTIAAKNLGYESSIELLEGPVSVAFGYDDVTAPARILNDFAKKNKNLELKGGIIDGQLYDVDKIKKIASIPSKDVLIAKLLGSFKAPISSFAYLIKAIKDNKESEEA